MDLSKIKRIVLEEGRVVVIDGDDAFVAMSFDEYKRLKNSLQSNNKEFEEPREFQEQKVIEAGPISQEEQKDETDTPEKINSELTLDDLPF